MKKLLIVESPAKIKTIKKFLDADFKITSTMGHIMDLPTKEIGVTINDSIDIAYVPIKDKDKVIAELCKEASKADIIYLAPDPDREGEIIAWHAAHEIEKVRKKKSTIYRIAFNEITKEAILNAIEHPGVIDEQKVAAQQARRVLDRWVGYEVSPVLWKKVARGLSAGRVQSVALRLICDREQAIRIFKPEEYWSVEGAFLYHGSPLNAELSHISKKAIDLKNKEQVDTILAGIAKEQFQIDTITDKKRSKKPNPPFMTSTLQQAAYNRLGFAVKKTMTVAQQLYEGVPLEDATTPVALITYMRTDSLRIADSIIPQVRTFIEGQYGKEYTPASAVVYAKAGKGKTQDAHEAIRPINVSLTPQKVRRYVSAEQAKLYELIWQRFVACQMKNAEYAQRIVTITGGKYTFKVTGSTLLFDGFLKVYGADEDDKEDVGSVLPADLKEKESVDKKTVTPKQHFTQPPARYTEASLVKELEKEGIGRPSTYATILNTIRERAYTQLDTKKRFAPTELGMAVTTLLVQHLPKLMDPTFTAQMEKELDKIAGGELERDELLRTFYSSFQQDLDVFRGADGQGTKRIPIPTDLDCPECGKAKLLIRFGKSGEFVGCATFPTCSFTSNFKRNDEGVIELVEAQPAAVVDINCPLCGKPLREVRGKFGTFLACSGYPECKYIHQETASFKCPLCSTGSIVRKKWKKGKFWGCNNYPTCTFAIFDEIEEKPCPKCKLPFLIVKTAKDGSKKYHCSSKECGYTE